MALKEPFMVKTQGIPISNDPLTLTADTGQSILVKGIGCACYGGSEFAEALIGRLSVGYFRLGFGNVDNHLEHDNNAIWFPNLHDYLVKLGIFKGFPIAEGETFTFKNVTVATQHFSRVIYELHDAGDITKDMPNGSESTEFNFLNYGTNTAAIATDTYGDIDFPLNPKEYPNFPFGADVPSGKEIDVHGILLKNWGGRDDDTAANMRFLRLTKGRQVLFDEDRLGIYVTQGMGHFTWHTRQARMPFLPFPEPMTFYPGEELKVELSGAATEIKLKDVVFALVETVRTV